MNPTRRRDFVRTVAFGAVVAPVSAIADDEKKVTPEPPDALSEIDARMAIVLARFGKHAQLDDKAKAVIRAEIAGTVRRGEALRKLSLGNGDGPFPVFHPYRAPLG